MSKYRMIQLTNNNIGVVATNAYLPLGNVTRSISIDSDKCDTFTVSTSGADTVQLNMPGYYNITYSGSVSATATGAFTVNLLVGGATAQTYTQTVGTALDYVPVVINFTTRVFSNCCTNSTNTPQSIQLQLSENAITSGTGNLVIERVY